MVQRRRQPTRRHTAQVGFTLIEVLLVLVILAVLGTIAASNFFGAKDRADINAAKGQIGMFSSSIDMFKFDCKQYPDKLDDLVEKPSDSSLAERWTTKYLDKSKIPADPWGNEYKYTNPGKKNSDGYDVWSTGPDGQDGTDDDIGNWED